MTTPRLTIAQAEAEGYTVDTHVYPPLAYKGPRFQTTETMTCFTSLEAQLIEALQGIADLTCESDVYDLASDDAVDDLNTAVGSARWTLGLIGLRQGDNDANAA